MTLTTSPFDDDHLHEECGVFGIFGTPDAAAHTALGLHALQHRGQEATGIVATDGEQFHARHAVVSSIPAGSSTRHCASTTSSSARPPSTWMPWTARPAIEQT